MANETSVAAGITVRDYIFSSTGLDAVIRAFEELSLQLAGVEGDRLSSLLQRFEQAQEALDRLGYYDADARAEQLIAGIKLGGVTMERLASTLSGGQKTKLALARLLFQAPDVLLLDEPTNFLDVAHCLT